MSAGRYSEALHADRRGAEDPPCQHRRPPFEGGRPEQHGAAGRRRKSRLDQANRPEHAGHALAHPAGAGAGRRGRATIIAQAEQLYGELIKQVPGEVLPKQALADIYKQTGRYSPGRRPLRSRGRRRPGQRRRRARAGPTAWSRSTRPTTAINVLDAVNENALRYVDAQLRLIELYLMRIDAYTDRTGQSAGQGDRREQRRPARRCWATCSLAGRAIAGLNDRTESHPLLPLAGRLVVRRLQAREGGQAARQHGMARPPPAPCRQPRPDRPGLPRGLPALSRTRPRRPRPRGRAGAYIFRCDGVAVEL